MSPSRRKRTDGGARSEHGPTEARFDPDTLLRRARDGSISPPEVKEVARRLYSRDPDVRLSTLIAILGETAAVEYQRLIEEFLDDSRYHDVSISWAALKTLVSKWGVDSPAIRVALHRFLAGAGWDEHNDLRMLAISLAGTMLSKAGDREFADWLVRYARMEVEVRPDTKGANDWLYPAYWTELQTQLQEAAVVSLAQALGYSWQEVLPLPSRRSQERADWYEKVVGEATVKWLSSSTRQQRLKRRQNSRL